MRLFRRRGAGPGGILERKRHAVADRCDEIEGGLKISLGFAGKPHDEIARQQDIRPGGADAVHQFQIGVGGMFAVHRLKNTVRPGLHRQMQIGHQFRLGPMGRNQRVIHVVRVGGGVTDPVQPVDPGQLTDQCGQPARIAMPGIHILPQQGDFAHACGHQIAGLSHNAVSGAADFGPTGIGDDTKGAKLVAAFLHGQKRTGTTGHFRAGGQVVKLVVQREFSVQCPLALRHLIHHRRQTVITLRANDQIDQRHPAQNLGPLGLGHTAGDTDAQIRVCRFQRTQTANIGKHLFGGLFADMAGVDQHQIGLFCLIRGDIALRAHGFDHTFAVIDIHLTAIGFDEQFFGRRHGQQRS